MIGFARVLLAESTKLRSVRGWTLALLASIVLTVSISLLAASASGTDANASGQFVVGPRGQAVVDDFQFAHKPLDGDGSIVAKVDFQDVGKSGALAGLMIKESARSGAPFAAVAVAAGEGVRLLSNFDVDRLDPAVGAPRWLRLTRAGSTVTAEVSADGTDWRTVGTVDVPNLPPAARIGLFVNSPPDVRFQRSAGSTSLGELPTLSTATFDDIRLDGSGPTSARWSSDVVQRPSAKFEKVDGGLTESAGVVTLTGTGFIRPDEPGDDMVTISLAGVLVGLMAIVAVSVLFVTSEYRRGLIRTTFTVCPRRRQTVAAKAVVIGAAAFAVGLVASFVSFFVAIPVLQGRGFAPPAFPEPSLSDWNTLRAVVGAAAFLAVIAVFSLGLGAVLRRSAGAITLAVGLLLLPAIIGPFLPSAAGKALMLITPAGGLAIQRAKKPDPTLVEPWAAINPWVGFAVLCVYAAAALVAALWLVRRRDA